MALSTIFPEVAVTGATTLSWTALSRSTSSELLIDALLVFEGLPRNTVELLILFEKGSES